MGLCSFCILRCLLGRVSGDKTWRVLRIWGQGNIFSRGVFSYSFIWLHEAESLLLYLHSSIFQLVIFNPCSLSTWYLLSTILVSASSDPTSYLTPLVNKINSLAICLYEISVLFSEAPSPLLAAPSQQVWKAPVSSPRSPILPAPYLPASSLFANTLHKEAASVKINHAEIWETETMSTSTFIIGKGNLFDFHLQTVACICSSPCSPSPSAVFCTNSGSLCLVLSLVGSLFWALSHKHLCFTINIWKKLVKLLTLIAWWLSANTSLPSAMGLIRSSHLFYLSKILLLTAGFYCLFTPENANTGRPVFLFLIPKMCCHMGIAWGWMAFQMPHSCTSNTAWLLQHKAGLRI